MPVYVYRCDECRELHELYRRVGNRDAWAPCPKLSCIGGELHRVIQVPSVASVAGLPRDRFKVGDKIKENRQRAHEEGW